MTKPSYEELQAMLEKEQEANANLVKQVAQLEEDEKFIMSVIASLPIGIAINTVIGGDEFFFANDNYYRYWRITPEQLASQSFFSAVFDDTEFAEKSRKKVEADCATDDPKKMIWEKVRIKKDGKDYFVNARNIPIPGTDRYVSIVEDITDRVLFETELKEAQQNFELVVQNNQEIVFMLDREGNITLSEGKGLGALNEEPGKGVGNSIYDFYEDYPEIQSAVRRALNGETVVQDQSAGGQSFKTWYIPIYNYEKLTGVLGFALNTTKRLKAEKALKEKEDQLKQSQKMEAIGTLAGGIAHDFNNILGIILGNAELARDDIETSDAQESFDEIISACKRAKDVVRQLLIFSRKSNSPISPVRIDEVVYETAKFMRSSTPSSVEISEDISTSKYVMGNSTQLSQVLINLCMNASQAMSGVGRIRLKVKECYLKKEKKGLPKGDYIEVKVKDDGGGIAQAHLHKIFEPYFTTKEVGKGTGLGLSIVHGIVENHQGLITVKSKAGKGTTFKIMLPVTDFKTGSQKAEAPAEKIKKVGRILLVDDEPSILSLQQRILELNGYFVEIYENPKEALAVFTENQDSFDLVITDLTMPEMTGDKLAEELLQLRADLPIILSTGYSEKIPSQCVSKVLNKPVVKEELLLAISEVLTKAGQSS